MLTRILLYIKHNFKFIWRLIDLTNGHIFRLLYSRRINAANEVTLSQYFLEGYKFRRLNKSDLISLFDLFDREKKEYLKYFQPHGFDKTSLIRTFLNRSIIMMGVFEDNKLIGYFFLRCFINRKCFVGRYVSEDYRGKGIGLIMNQIMYNTAWKSGFRCLSTISKKNKLVVSAHAHNKNMKLIRELENDYLIVEFVCNDKQIDIK